MGSEDSAQAFRAMTVSFSEETGASILCLASDRGPSPKHYLVLKFANDSQDEALGFSGIYFELDDEISAAYFSEAKVAISETELRLWLKARWTPSAIELRIGLDIPRDDFSMLRDGIQRILELNSKHWH